MRLYFGGWFVDHCCVCECIGCGCLVCVDSICEGCEDSGFDP